MHIAAKDKELLLHGNFTRYWQDHCCFSSMRIRGAGKAPGLTLPEKECYDLLKAYHAITGIPSLINTSFNYHEEPIISSPKQAVNLLKKGIIEVLAMPPHIVFNNPKWKRLLEERDEEFTVSCQM